MNRRSSTLQMLGFTIALLFAVVLLLTGLGVFSMPTPNDLRDWNKYYDKRDALWAEHDKLAAEFELIIPSDIDAILVMFNDSANAAEVEAWMAKLKAWQKKNDEWQRKYDKLNQQYPLEVVSKYAPYHR